MADRVQDTAQRYSGRTAVVGSGRRLLYADLSRQIDQWQERCARLGLPERSIVVIVCDGQPELPGAFLGVRAAGLVPVLVDGLASRARAAAVVDAARPGAVLRLRASEVVRTGTPDPRVLPAGAGYVTFSSGSQGTPKGIIGQEFGLLHFLDWEIETLGIRPGTRTGMLTSPSFDVVFRDLLLPLLAGGELHIAENAVRTAPAAVMPWIAGRALNVLHAVPSLASRWLVSTAITAPDLRWTLFAGEPLYEQHVARWRSAAPNSTVINLYGPSEATLAQFWYEVPDPPGPGLQPVGHPLPGIGVELEPATGPDAAAETYSVTLTTPYGSLGYLPGTCPASDERRLRRASGTTRFQTRDRGHFADGNLVVAGRLDSLVKRHGVFVDVAAIESAAADLPEVRAACCLQLMPSGQIVLAVEGPAESTDIGLRRLLQPLLGAELPDLVLAVPALPLLPSGKADRGAVRSMLTAQERDREQDARGGPSPTRARTDQEECR